jgi:hypothetical protein
MTLTIHPAVSELRRVPGYCYWGPSALDAEANYGTKLGFTEAGVDWSIGYATAKSRAEERGEEPVAKWYLGAECRVWVIFKSWNATTLARAWPGLNSGTDVQYPNDFLAGTRLDSATYAGKFLFMPYDECAVNMCLMANYAVPNVEETARIRLRLNDDTNIPIVFDCFRHPSAAGGETAYASLFVGDKANVTVI